MINPSEVATLPCWHDNPIYGMHWRCAAPDRNLWHSDLVLDIDHILEWVKPADGYGVRFLIAPAMLVFHDAFDFAIGIDCAVGDGHRRFLHELSIDRIERQAIASEGGCFHWRIELNWPRGGRIRFGASRFSQTLSAPPRLCGEQRFPNEHRPPFTLAALP